MFRRLSDRSARRAAALLVAAAFWGQCVAGQRPDEVTEWLRQHARPIAVDQPPTRSSDVAPNDGGAPRRLAADLVPLRSILKSARVVALAESTHGTKEFFDIRSRMLRYMVEEMGFNTLAFEGSYSAAQALDDYIVRGDGDPKVALSQIGVVWWDVEEFLATIRWMRKHNRSLPDARKVRLLGMDIWNTSASRDRILAHLRRVAPSKVQLSSALFRKIALSEANGMMRSHEHLDMDSYRQLKALMEDFTARRDTCVRLTSVDECDQIARDFTIIARWMRANLTDELTDEVPSWMPKVSTLNNYARSRSMADNLLDRMREDSRAKVVIWAHVFHLTDGFPDAKEGVVPNMGRYLREQLGRHFYVFGMEAGDGAYLARMALPDETLGDFRIGHMPVSPEGSLPAQLTKLGMPAFFVDLRSGMAPAAVAQWLARPIRMHAISWVYFDPPGYYFTRATREAYDGLIFVSHTSVTTPTETALKAVAERTSY